jgi:hypothetical protein
LFHRCHRRKEGPAIDGRGKLAERVEHRIRPCPLCITLEPNASWSLGPRPGFMRDLLVEAKQAPAPKLLI